MPAGALNTMVESHFSDYLDAIQSAGGDINETAGDGFMAIFESGSAHSHGAVNGDALLRLQALKEFLGGGTGGDSPIWKTAKSPAM